MGELGQLHAVLFAQKALVMPPLSDIIDLYCLIAFRRHEQFAGVVVVERENAGLWAAILDVLAAEELARYQYSSTSPTVACSATYLGGPKVGDHFAQLGCAALSRSRNIQGVAIGGRICVNIHGQSRLACAKRICWNGAIVWRTRSCGPSTREAVNPSAKLVNFRCCVWWIQCRNSRWTPFIVH